MTKLYDVIIAGAGPIGLFLACELALAGVSVLVLERSHHLNSPWKGNPLGSRNLNSPAVEILYWRGLEDQFFDPRDRASSLQKTSGFRFGGHFAAILLNSNRLELDRWKYRIPGPSLAPDGTSIQWFEIVLNERAKKLGITIIRGCGVTRIISQDSESVTVEAGEQEYFQGRWLVGCDGGRSAVRRAAGFDFVGTEPKFTGYAMQCELDHPERLKGGFQVTETGMYVFGRPDALWLIDFDGGAFDRKAEPTKEHLQEVLCRVSGSTDLRLTNVHLASTFSDRSKQTTRYRNGRVLLAGDAAHVHPPLGSPGLTTGLGDAINLGWKLAATIRHEASSRGQLTDLTLLDTYESERHPVAASVLEWTRTQVLAISPDMHGRALRSLINDVIETADGHNLFLDRHWGLSQRYNLGDFAQYAHPLVGSSMPNLLLLDGSRLGSKLHKARGLLVDLQHDAALKRSLGGKVYSSSVDYVSVSAKDKRGLGAFLVRPDGIVAWVAEEKVKYDVDTLRSALEKWFRY